MSWELKAFKLTLWLDTDLAVGAFDELELLDMCVWRVFDDDNCVAKLVQATCSDSGGPNACLSSLAPPPVMAIVGFSTTPDKATAVLESISRIGD